MRPCEYSVISDRQSESFLCIVIDQSFFLKTSKPVKAHEVHARIAVVVSNLCSTSAEFGTFVAERIDST